MVLAQLGGSISRALHQMSNATIIDEKVLNDCLNEFARALLQSDVQLKLVHGMQTNIKKIVNLSDPSASDNKRKIIQQAFLNELCKILDPGKPAFAPKKEKPSVVMFVGLQGSRKTTTCTKYAFHHQRKGYKPALVCADTFRAAAFDQLKQYATKAKIPFYGSYTESDPARIAVEGVERFKKENCDLIIVDTSGRHKQEAALFEEMRQVSEATKPDLVILVMDSKIGQAAFDQAQAFKQSVQVGAVIVTKMDGHAKEGGALSAVAAARCPIIFMMTGEHLDDLEVFDVEAFVSRILGTGDRSGLMDKIQDVVPMDQQHELLKKRSEGDFTLRVMYETFQEFLEMGPLQPLLFPEFSSGLLPKETEKIKRYMTLMDSMTNEELDRPNPKLIKEPRLVQIAGACGYPVSDALEMLELHKQLAKDWRRNKIPKNTSPFVSKSHARQIGDAAGLQRLIVAANGLS